MHKIFIFVAVLLLGIIPYVIIRENYIRKVCEINDGTYALGVCFKNEIIVRIK